MLKCVIGDFGATTASKKIIGSDDLGAPSATPTISDVILQITPPPHFVWPFKGFGALQFHNAAKIIQCEFLRKIARTLEIHAQIKMCDG